MISGFLVRLRQVILLVLALVLMVLPKGSASALAPVFLCETNSVTTTLISQTSQTMWADWIRKLSGEAVVLIRGEEHTITSRYSYSMFDGSTNARAYDFVLETLQEWYADEAIEEDPYGNTSWKNLILTIPGSSRPDEVIIMSAHLDSISRTSPTLFAPGAEDNASGSAALLEAARLLRGFQFSRTIKLIWFTGEEQGLYGSRAYVEDHDLSGVLGVLNLDMYGYDSDDDGCFELHVGTLETSAPVGLCMVESIAAYEIPLTFDYFTTGATTASDHSSFWEKGIGAVEIGENFEFNNFADGCVGRDLNPNYHTAGDTIDKLNLPVGFNITKAALATLFNMAGEPPPYYPVFLPILVK